MEGDVKFQRCLFSRDRAPLEKRVAIRFWGLLWLPRFLLISRQDKLVVCMLYILLRGRWWSCSIIIIELLIFMQIHIEKII